MITLRTFTRRVDRLAWRSLLFSTGARIGLTIFVLTFLVLDVMQTSVASTKGFKISQLQNNIAVLEQENRRLSVQIASYQSMQSIQQRLQGLALVPVDAVSYARIADTTIVQR